MPPIETFNDLTRRDREIVLDTALRLAGTNPNDETMSKCLFQAFKVATFTLYPPDVKDQTDATSH